MIKDYIFTALAVCMSGVFFGFLSYLYLERDAKKRSKNRNDRGAVPIAMVIMVALAHIAVATFIVQDAKRDRDKTAKTVQILQPARAREADPNASTNTKCFGKNLSETNFVGKK